MSHVTFTTFPQPICVRGRGWGIGNSDFSSSEKYYFLFFFSEKLKILVKKIPNTGTSQVVLVVESPPANARD